MSVLSQIRRVLEEAEAGLFHELIPEYMMDYFTELSDESLILELNGYFGCRLDTSSPESWLEDFKQQFIPCLFL